MGTRTMLGEERPWRGWLWPLAVAFAWVPFAHAQSPQSLPTDLLAPAISTSAQGDSASASGSSSQIVPVSCTSCNTGLIGGSLPPPDPGVSGCTSCGNCYPGRQPCYPCDDKKTFVGQFFCSLYACICCPDPCYEGKWIPLADSAFYFDAVRPVTQTKLRWDGGRDLIDPDRSEFFWARDDGKGKGPKPPPGYFGESRLRYDDLTLVTEGSNGTIGVAVAVPFRNIQGDVDGHFSGMGDLTIATKTLIFDCELLQFAIQMKVYTPTGNFLKGLGTGHVSLEPSGIVAIKVAPKTYIQGQLAEWIPIGGDTTYQGDVLHYHVSLNQQLFALTPNVPIIGVLETNCWTFQHGDYTDPGLGPYQRASGTTYATMGAGVRMFVCDKIDFGLAFAHAVTSVRLARDIYTAEFRLRY